MARSSSGDSMVDRVVRVLEAFDPDTPTLTVSALAERADLPADEALETRGAVAAGEEDVLEETPEFLQETPEHDRLWFEQKPPRDFHWHK